VQSHSKERGLVIDGISTQWYLDVLRLPMRRRLVRFLSILSFLVFGSSAMAQVGTCVTASGDSIAPWTDGTDPACGSDCAPAQQDCSLSVDACGQDQSDASQFHLNSALVHFKRDLPEPVEAIDGPSNDAPSCLNGAPLCGSGGPHTAYVTGGLVLVLPSFNDVIPPYRGGLLPFQAAWPEMPTISDHLEPPMARPPRTLGA